MLKGKHLVRIVGALVLALFVNVAGTALAASPQPGHTIPPESLPVKFERFSHITQGLAPELQNAQAAQVSITSTCMTFTYGVNARSLTGTMLYSWAESVGWCYNGTQVTYHSVAYTPRVAAGWSYLGIDNSFAQDGPNNSFFQARATGKFGYACILPQLSGCAYTRYPWVNITVYGNGQYQGSGDPDER